MNNAEIILLLEDLDDLAETLKYTNISSYKVVKQARKLIIDFYEQKRRAENDKVD